MNLYLWEKLAHVSTNYHSKGGLVVVANDEDHAKALIDAYNEASENQGRSRKERVVFEENEWEKHEVFPLASETQPRVIIFPDAGCCQ